MKIMDGHWTNGKNLIMFSCHEKEREKERDVKNKIKSLNLYILYTRYMYTITYIININ